MKFSNESAKSQRSNTDGKSVTSAQDTDNSEHRHVNDSASQQGRQKKRVCSFNFAFLVIFAVKQ